MKILLDAVPSEPDKNASKKAPTANMLGALNAMNRAAKNARQLALQTGTNLILVRNGQVVAVSPHDVADPV